MNHLSPVPANRPLRILVYTLIPEGQENQPVARSRFRTLTNRTRRVLDLAQWRLQKKWRAHYSTFKDLKNTNRGDIAIRLGVRHQLNQAFDGLPAVFLEAPWGELAEGLKRHAPLDLVVIAGGGYLFADKDGRLPPRFQADVEALARTSVPVVATSIGVNQIITGHAGTFRFAEDQHPLLNRFLARLSLVSVRDAATQDALAFATGTTPPVIIDPAFLLPPGPGPERASGIPLSIGLNVAFHGTDLTEKNARSLPILIEGLRTLSRTVPCRFTYFVHSNSERGIALALRLSGIPCDIVDGDPATLLAAYRKIDIHIGQMLHSAIFAMSVGIPTLALAYDVKSRPFFELFGLEHLCLDSTRFTAGEFVTAVQGLIADRAQIAQQLRTRRTQLGKESESFYTAIRTVAYRARVEAPTKELSVARNTIQLTPPIRVSTVIPAFNARPFIARALDSVFAQRLPSSEIIVVDDGSTDGTREFVATYKDRGVRLICHEKRGGAAAARNTGIAAARGEYVAFLDADDEWLPGKLERQLAVVSANPNMTFISCRANLIDEDGIDSGDIYRGALPAQGPEAWRTLLAYPCVATPTVLVRRQALTMVGSFNKWLPVAEDQDMWIRLSLLGEVGHIPETLVRVYNTPGSLSKAAIRDQAVYVLPMVSAYVERTRDRLSQQDVNRILGERHSKVGQWAYANRDWWFGLCTMWRAILYGEDPVKILSYVVRASSLVQWVKREVHAFSR